MGGRGAKANRTNPYGAQTKANLAKEGVAVGGGGGGDIGTDGFAPYGGADLANFTVVSSDLRDTGAAWNAIQGSITIKDSNGKLHTSKTIADSGVSRTTFMFKDFVIKIEGLKNTEKDQNGGDIRFLSGVSKADRKYFTQILSNNKTATLKVDGKNVQVKALAAVRAKPIKGKLTSREFEQLSAKFHKIRDKYKIFDSMFPDFNYVNKADGGHNVMVVNRGLFQFYDYGLPLKWGS